MRIRNRVLTGILCAALLAALYLPSNAAHVTGAEAIETLSTLGLLAGSDGGFEPDRAATRAETVVMLLRLLGRQAEAGYAGISSPYVDGGWADHYLGYARAHGLVYGISDTYFGCDNAVSARDFLSMALRALGYEDYTDFTWWGSLDFAERIGLTHGEYAAGGEFLREDMALVAYTALTLKMKGSDLRLIDSLHLNGAVSAENLARTRLANAIHAGRTPHTAAEIHEMSASAVLYVEVFDSEEDLQQGKKYGNGSASLITSDGVAVLCYHVLEGHSYARATMTDGRSFDITGVLYYNVNQDIAVVRLSRTDTDGNAARFFPWLEVGDSDAVSTGDPVYTVSNPLGLIDSITDGLVSNRSRIVDDPAYPCIQISAAIASGSSGGALLNPYGEVIGVLFASYTQGENMNLAVPINCIRGADLTAAGQPVSAVREAEDAKKAAATITATETNITLKEGESKEIVISSDCPGQLGVQYRIEDYSMVTCKWGEFVTKQSCVLELTGEEAGSTKVTITFAYGYGNEDASLVLNVNVMK